jgi:hypothetical protein
MILKWTGFTAFVLTVAALAWGVSGLIEHSGCPDGRNRCAAAVGTGKYFAATMISAFAVFGGFYPVVRTVDWRPTLGLPTGAVIGAGIALWRGQSLGFWILVAALLVGAGVTTIVVRAVLTSFSDVHQAPNAC